MPADILTYILVGPNAGASGIWGGKTFVAGQFLYQPPSQFDAKVHAALLDKSLANYGAFRDGTASYEYATASYEAMLAGLDAPEPPLPVPEAGPELGDEPEAEGFVNQALVAAIMSLNPDNDLMWTRDGKPFLAFVERAYGQGGLNRRMVDDALPGYNRAAALQMLADKAQIEVDKDHAAQVEAERVETLRLADELHATQAAEAQRVEDERVLAEQAEAQRAAEELASKKSEGQNSQ